MELRLLRSFLAIARESSFTGAARFLRISQPALTRQIQDLERALGQSLFVRSSHRITLTSEGMLLRKRAEEILEMVHKTEAEFEAIGEEAVGGDVHIGGGETAVMRRIAEIIGDLRKEYPEVRYHLFSGNADDVMERLDRGTLDFGILIQPVDLAKYNHVTLPGKDVWGVAMRKDSPLAAKKAVTRKDLVKLPLICSRQVMRRSSGGNAYSDWFGKDMGKLNVVATYNLIYNAALLVAEGIGYAITLENLLNVTDQGSLCFRPLQPRLESGLNIVWKKYQLFSAAAEVFLNTIQRHFPDNA